MTFPSEKFNTVLNAVEDQKFDLKILASRIFPLIDLTSLNDNDTLTQILSLCHQASHEFGHVAAVCFLTQFVSFAKSELAGKLVKVATVVNFPNGDAPLDDVVLQIQQAIVNGADEVDVVWPYQAYLSNDSGVDVSEFLRACREACGRVVKLKIILETGAFPSPESIYAASRLIIDADVDFLKTSTGKINIGATPEAACAMLLAIKESKKPVGLKVSGGLHTTEQAAKYLLMADYVMGKDWVSPETFRFGASTLLHDVLDTL